MVSQDYYKVLGVSRESSKEDIKKAYKKLARKYHPDISKEADSEVKFKEINEAAGVLLDDERKQRYDTYGSSDGPQGFSGGSGFGGGFNPSDFGINLDDIFEQFGFSGGSGFGGFNSRGSSRNQKETSVYEEIEISLDDVYKGVEKEIKINIEDKCDDCNGTGAKNSSDIQTCSNCNGTGVVIENQRSILGIMRTQRTCPKCNGSGKEIKNPCSTCSGIGTENNKKTINLKIPKGIENGTTLRVTNKGSYNTQTKSYGDLYLKVYVKNHKIFEVDGSDLYMNLDVNFIQAIVGDEIEFKHFDKTLSLKVPEGTQPNAILRLKEKGLPHFNYPGFGNLYVKVNVEIPKTTNSKQKEILMDYAKTLKDKGFIDRLKSLFK